MIKINANIAILAILRVQFSTINYIHNLYNYHHSHFQNISSPQTENSVPIKPTLLSVPVNL